MNKNKQNQINESALLKFLLSKVYSERNQLGKELHASKVHLNELSIIIGRLERDIDKIKIDPKILDEQKQAIHQFQDELKRIRYDLYPPLLNLSGILVGIKQFIMDYLNSHPVNAELNFDEKEREAFGQIKDVRVYKSCVEIIRYLFISKVKVFKVELKCDTKYFEFRATSKSRALRSAIENDNEKEMLIKSYIIWAGGIVDEKTDWKNNFQIKFKL